VSSTRMTIEIRLARGEFHRTKKGADHIAEFLIAEKILYIFRICGHGNVEPLDALYDVKDHITLISPRHEQVGGHMDDAYFRVKHEAVAPLTPCGPGSAYLVMPMAVAQTDSSVLLAITANVPTSQFNCGPFQEINHHNQTDFPNIIRPVVKHGYQPSRVKMLPLALRQAATTMLSGRPGPVNIDIPFNFIPGRGRRGNRAPVGRSQSQAQRGRAR